MFNTLCRVIELTVTEHKRQAQFWEDKRRWERQETVRQLKKEGIIKSEAELGYQSGCRDSKGRHYPHY